MISVPPSPADRRSGPSLDGETTDALQAALSAEHAALWCYSLAVAFLPTAQRGPARDDLGAHRSLRAQIEQTLAQVGTPAVSAQPAYSTPQPVTDEHSAAALLVVAEDDATVAWRSVLEHTTEPALRTAALQALTAATVRGARWRRVAGTTPAIPAFPGRPA